MKPTRYYSKLQEKQVADTVNGKTVVNSGATPYRKGDVIEKEWLIECKTCMMPKQSFAIKKQWLKTIKEEAKQQGKINYCLAFNFEPNGENYYILSEDKFKQLFSEEE